MWSIIISAIEWLWNSIGSHKNAHFMWILVVGGILVSGYLIISHKNRMLGILNAQEAYRTYIFSSQTQIDKTLVDSVNNLRKCIHNEKNIDESIYSLSNNCIKWMQSISTDSSN